MVRTRPTLSGLCSPKHDPMMVKERFDSDNNLIYVGVATISAVMLALSRAILVVSVFYFTCFWSNSSKNCRWKSEHVKLEHVGLCQERGHDSQWLFMKCCHDVKSFCHGQLERVQVPFLLLLWDRVACLSAQVQKGVPELPQNTWSLMQIQYTCTRERSVAVGGFV